MAALVMLSGAVPCLGVIVWAVAPKVPPGPYSLARLVHEQEI